jgi:hypothetical protein
MVDVSVALWAEANLARRRGRGVQQAPQANVVVKLNRPGTVQGDIQFSWSHQVVRVSVIRFELNTALKPLLDGPALTELPPDKDSARVDPYRRTGRVERRDNVHAGERIDLAFRPQVPTDQDAARAIVGVAADDGAGPSGLQAEASGGIVLEQDHSLAPGETARGEMAAAASNAEGGDLPVRSYFLAGDRPQEDVVPAW